MTPRRCAWLGKWEASADPIYRDYHDLEWGIPSHDERHLFEMLCLEGAQAGLSWITVLKKRARYRELFENFEVERVASFTEADLERLLLDPGIIRNRAKIAATIGNARAWLALREREGSVVEFLWSFTGGKTLIRSPASLREVPASSAESDAMSKALRKAGFRFVGSTICYAFMQATGMVDDHTTDCFRHSGA